MTSSNIDIVIAVWGNAYTTPFLAVTVPSLLSPGNLPAVAEKCRVRLTILTSSDDSPRLMENELIGRVRRYAQVSISVVASIEEMKKFHKYALSTYMMRRGVQIAEAAGADVIFLGPESILSDGTLLNMHEALKSRHGIVLVPSIRVAKFSFLSELMGRYGPEIGSTGTLALAPRDLADLALRHRHPIIDEATVSLAPDGAFHCRPPIFYWSIGDTGLLLRSFIWTPMYVKPRRWMQEVPPAIDFHDLTKMCGLTPDEVVPASDSDDILLLEISDHATTLGAPNHHRDRIDGAIDWLGRIGRPHHVENLRHSYLLHSEDIDEGRMRTVEEQADSFVSELRERTAPLIEYKLAPSLCDDKPHDTEDASGPSTEWVTFRAVTEPSNERQEQQSP